jgi:hypothetical protein
MKKPFIRISECFSIVVFFLLTLLSISGVGFLESLRFAFVAGLICVSGGQLWIIVSKSYDLSAFEFIGMGLALGSAASSFSQILLRTTPLSGVAWSFVCVLIPVGLKYEFHQDFGGPKTLFSKANGLPAILTYLDLTAVVAFALAWHWWWIYPFAITAMVSSLTLRMHIQKNSATTFWAFILGFLFLVPIYFWCTTLRVRNDLWRIISHDQVFSESLSWSLNTFGRSDSPFLSGFEFNYHWLALHWAGLLTQSSNGGAWISVTQVIPILSYLGIFCLIVTISSKAEKRQLNIVVTAIPFLFLSNVLGFNLERYIVSPTFQFTCIWMLATINVLFSLIEKFSWTKLAFTGLMIFTTLGGKLMNGLVILGGLTFVALISQGHREAKNRKIFSLTLLVSLLATACAFFYFFRTNQVANTNSLKFAVRIGSDVGIVRPDSRFQVQVFGAVVFNLAMTLPILITIIFLIRKNSEYKILFKFLAASMIAGIAATTLTTHEGVSQLYFVLAALVLSLTAYPVIAREIRVGPPVFWKVLVCAAVFGVISQLFWTYANDISDYRMSVYLKLTAVSLCPLLAIGTHLWQRSKSLNMNSLGENFAQICFIVFMVSSVSIGIFQRAEKLPAASRYFPVNHSDPSLITGSTDHLQILYWIRQNTNSNDIVAINRFCMPGVDSCIMKWQLVSAISHRRVLLEGGYGSPGNLQAGEIQDRFEISSQFANSPDEISLKILCDKGVKWFFYDHYGITPRVDWYPHATVKMSNESVSLLKLNCSSSRM